MKGKTMINTLTKKEIKQLNKLGKGITISLDLNKTDLNNIGVPSRTNRLQAVKDMIEYLKIHNLRIYETDEDGYQVEI
tara:strand:+ start:27 stop:260 length:234 start_codon:yes stop_codon:yes gene_type:complete